MSSGSKCVKYHLYGYYVFQWNGYAPCEIRQCPSITSKKNWFKQWLIKKYSMLAYTLDITSIHILKFELYPCDIYLLKDRYYLVILNKYRLLYLNRRYWWTFHICIVIFHKFATSNSTNPLGQLIHYHTKTAGTLPSSPFFCMSS